ncbi:MAG: ABC transporter ATP-binding protein [Candidatus Bipolaricaulaceae bacterium]
MAKDFFFGLIDILQNSAFLLAGVAILFWLDWRLALAALALLPALAVVSKHMNTRMALLCRDIQEGEARASQELGEALSGALHARLLGIHAWLMARISHALDLVRGARVCTNVYGAKAGGALTFVTSFGPVLFLVLGAYFVLRGKTTLGTLVAFMTFLRFLFGPTQRLILTRLNLERSKVAAARVFELLDLPPEPEGGASLSIFRPALAVRDVSFTYPNGKEALHRVSLEVEAGEWVALAGAVGSGKSTLLALIVRLFPHEQGQILLDGKEVQEFSLPELRQVVLLVPQENFLFSGSVWENLALGDAQVSEEEVRRVCRALGAEEFLRELPEGLHTRVGERGAKLSGGQRQLLALVRAVLRRPKVLLLDEATSAMDAEAEARVFAGLRELLPETTVILAAHRLSTVRAADRIFVLREGRVVRAGRYEELVQEPGEFRELFAQQLALEAQR